MSIAMRSAVVVGAMLAWLSPVPAQSKPAPQDAFERATKADEKGLLQWADYVPKPCPACSGRGKTACATCAGSEKRARPCPECGGKETRETTCRTCAGLGVLADPLAKAPCPTCAGAAFLLCAVCDGDGTIELEGEAPAACPACRGEGGFKCATCEGRRLVDAAAPKPSLREAGEASLGDAMAATAQALEELAAFKPTGKNARRDVKTFLKTLEKAQPCHPALKRAKGAVERFMERIHAAEDIEAHEEDEAKAMRLIRDNATRYLEHQRRMLELALDRAKANAKVGKDTKAK